MKISKKNKLLKINKGELNHCKCGNIIQNKSHTCKACWNMNQRKVERPTNEQLIEDIKNIGYVQTGKKYGVSDNAIRKWVK